jgi:SAM-dependent methyltransferase
MEEAGVRRPAPGSVVASSYARKRQTELTLGQLVTELDLALDEAERLDAPEHSTDVRLLGSFLVRAQGMLDLYPNRFSRRKTAFLADVLAKHPGISMELIRGGTFVDFGCGGINPLSGLAVLVAAGASRCCGIDLDPLQEELALPGLARTVMDLIAEPKTFLPEGLVTGEDVRRRFLGLDLLALEKADPEALNGGPLEYRNGSADATGLETASVDCVTSNSFLEHVPDPDAVIREMARITRHGGIGWHGIDGVDHRSYGQGVGPLDFLAVSSSEPLVFGCNRIRPLEFLGRFEAHGFEVLQCSIIRRVEIRPEERARMLEPWRSMPIEELESVGIRIALRRHGSS